MRPKLDVKQGTLALMILKTLEVLGPLHGYRVARRIEETVRTASRSTTARCTRAPRLERGSSRASGAVREQPSREVSSLTAAGRKQLAREAREWIRRRPGAFLAPRSEAP
jgi:DNA-binding PadR family transcriptional regulator